MDAVGIETALCTVVAAGRAGNRGDEKDGLERISPEFGRYIQIREKIARVVSANRRAYTFSSR